MFRALGGWAVVAVGLWGLGAHAEEPKWETISTTPYLVKTRALPNSSVKELHGEATLNAKAADLQAAILDADAYSKFMPYVVESRQVGDKETEDGVETFHAYARLDFGVVSARDYVVKVRVEQSVAPDGTGEFKNRWQATPDKLPERASTVRLKLTQGSWHVVPTEDGQKSKVVYRAAVDPGGWIPAFAANMGNKQGIHETFQAVEKEAQRRAKAK